MNDIYHCIKGKSNLSVYNFVVYVVQEIITLTKYYNVIYVILNQIKG